MHRIRAGVMRSRGTGRGACFELFGRFVNVVDDLDAMFDQGVANMTAFIGIVTLPTSPT
jgi:hypothetical protein